MRKVDRTPPHPQIHFCPSDAQLQHFYGYLAPRIYFFDRPPIQFLLGLSFLMACIGYLQWVPCNES